jgi:hypothetical protein
VTNVGKSANVNAAAMVFLVSGAAAQSTVRWRISTRRFFHRAYPEVAEPAGHNPKWTVEAVAATATDQLGRLVQPLGLRARPSRNRVVQSSASRESG